MHYFVTTDSLSTICNKTTFKNYHTNVAQPTSRYEFDLKQTYVTEYL